MTQRIDKPNRRGEHDAFLNNNRHCTESWARDPDDDICPRCNTPTLRYRGYEDCYDRDYIGYEEECKFCGWWDIYY